MALQDRNQWEAFLRNAGIPEAESSTYATKFLDNRVTADNILDFIKQDFIDLGITIIGDIKNIQRHAKSQLTTVTAADSTVPTLPMSFMKSPAAKLPHLNADMTHPQFRKFKTDWAVFKRITNLPSNQLHAQLYNSCDEHVQNSLVNTVTDFFSLTEVELLNMLEDIVPKNLIQLSTDFNLLPLFSKTMIILKII